MGRSVGVWDGVCTQVDGGGGCVGCCREREGTSAGGLREMSSRASHYSDHVTRSIIMKFCSMFLSQSVPTGLPASHTCAFLPDLSIIPSLLDAHYLPITTFTILPSAPDSDVNSLATCYFHSNAFLTSATTYSCSFALLLDSSIPHPLASLPPDERTGPP